MPAARILFMGTPEFAVPSLARLIEAGHEIIGVVTGPDKPRGRGQKLTPTPVKELAFRHHLPLLQPDSDKDPAFAEAVRALAPDIAVVVAFRILPRAVFAVPRLGTFNLHSSLLPRYRGAAPINWAVINGDTETGVTTFFLDDRVDTGEMLLQERIFSSAFFWISFVLFNVSSLSSMVFLRASNSSCCLLAPSRLGRR